MLRRRSVGAALILYICALVPALLASEAATPNTLDRELATVLSAAGFTGTIEQTYHARLEANLGRPIDPKLADLGRLLWFDTLHSLHHDNTCGGCHSPTNGFGDSQPMAIGVQNNGLVGPASRGPAEPAPLPARHQHGALPGVDVERPVQFAVRRSVRQLAGLPLSVSRGRCPVLACQRRAARCDAPAAGAGAHAADRADRSRPASRARVRMAYRTRRWAARSASSTTALGETVPLPDPSTGSRNEPIRQKALAAPECDAGLSRALRRRVP